MVATALEREFVPVVFSFDLEARRASVTFGTELETASEPIKNLLPETNTASLSTCRMAFRAFCAACCWALMLIQLVLGVTNLPS
ncbi:MAG: DUF2182 domain-containing protein [Acidobacteria bacterium]|nr:DUF2182 domain-containing protein [Acidobacteriota bacterium]